MVYDITDFRSFDSIRNWMEQIQIYGHKDVNKILVGNKCDLEALRIVTTKMGKELANEFGVDFFETSAKESINVEDSFTNITRSIKGSFFIENNSEIETNVSVASSDQQDDEKCC